MALPCPARSAPRMHARYRRRAKLPTWALCHLGQTTTPASAPTQISCWTVLGGPGAARGRSFGVNFEDFFRYPRQAGQGRRPAQLGPRAVAFDGGIWVDFFRSPPARQTPASPGHHAGFCKHASPAGRAGTLCHINTGGPVPAHPCIVGYADESPFNRTL